MVVSVLLYGFETTQITRCHLHSNFTNDTKRILVSYIKRIYKTSTLKFAGHCLRRDDKVFSNLVLLEPTNLTRRPVMPPERYNETI